MKRPHCCQVLLFTRGIYNLSENTFLKEPLFLFWDFVFYLNNSQGIKRIQKTFQSPSYFQRTLEFKGDSLQIIKISNKIKEVKYENKFCNRLFIQKHD